MPLQKTGGRARGAEARKGRAAADVSVAGGAWVTQSRDGLQILQARALQEIPWLVHGFSTRAGGTSTLDGERVLNLGFTDWDTRANVLSNRQRFLAAVGAEQVNLVTLRQRHSDIVHVFETPPARAPSADAAITRAPRLLLGIQTADCVPVLLVDVQNRAVAAVHAGWRGTLRRIVAKTLGQMHMVFGSQPSEAIAALGPAVHACCYEVGAEVAQAYASQFSQAREWFSAAFDQLASGEERSPLKWLLRTAPGHDPPPPRVQLDLIACNRWQLLDAGVAPSNIVSSELCTSCRTDLLFSYRRENGCTGRLLAVIGIRPK